MLASKEIGPPGGIGESVIGVRILVLPADVSPYIFPEHNRIGTMLLCRLLQARMELSGVRVTRASGFLQLNRSSYVFAVSALDAARDLVKEELNKLGLLKWAQIVSRDPEEGLYRIWHSKSGCFQLPARDEVFAEKELIDLIERSGGAPTTEDEPSGQ